MRSFPASLVLVLGLVGSCETVKDVSFVAPIEGSWVRVHESLDFALLSVWGRTADDVWAVGHGPTDGPPTVLHWDGEAWKNEDSGACGVDLWWVHGFDDGTLFAGGTQGAILRRDPDGTWASMPTPNPSLVVFGIWGATEDDVWAVGGAEGGQGGAFLWRLTGGEWKDATPAGLAGATTWWKVWGTAADDVFFCGTNGALGHWDGEEFTAIPSDTTRPLFTIHGREDGEFVVAVGGQFTATLVQSVRGGDFRDVTPTSGADQPFGVFVRGDRAFSVGFNGVVLVADGLEWFVEDTKLGSVNGGLHAVWIDPDGGVWAVGGKIIAGFDEGVVDYRGVDPPSSAFAP